LRPFLKWDKNEIVFKIKNSKSSITSYLYFWDHSERIVCSDVDGTVTKSDIGGHLLPRLGIDWAHEGIASLYTHIKQNGYKLLYLSSRSIGLKGATGEYLAGIKQGQFVMPEGLLLVSPERTAKSMWREVIIKKPHLFKIECL